MKRVERAMLLILDGWGLGQKPQADAIAKANTPFTDGLYLHHPHTTLTTFGEEVGLPEGQMGNSEVGHLNIGAGRVVYQELARINKAVRERELYENEVLLQALSYAKSNQVAVHLIGLVSDGGVHSHINHLKALCDITQEHDLEQVFIHAFMDGRDTDPKSGLGFLTELLEHIETQKVELASVIGRYYAMDRDKRWERVKLAYDLLVKGEGEATNDILSTLKNRYAENETDEFLKPIVCVNAANEPKATIKNGDMVLFFNFRTDRPREITEVLTQMDMPEYGMEKLNLHYVTMTRYDEKYENVHVLFTKDDVSNTIGEVLANAGKTQVRIAETEKYPHVTFFFSGGREQEFEGESRILISSPKVATYDLEPEMGAIEITDAIIEKIETDLPDFVCLNYANADMVGHTGVFEASMKAVETVDECLSRLVPMALEYDYGILIIADHGNSDFMINEDGTPNTAHTMNPVPCIYVAKDNEDLVLDKGKLADIAPTILDLMGIDIPTQMDGQVLLRTL
ncbi:MAG: 2,3-bisphosphoglycerate-independent phosphoglycerate mutase [Saprospiraceae bacterium]|nr:2,3-bisphosphoglycerate-independent phosphoglycerate mutase [Saprospiraceae bacterium]